jgi:hypothetical protein
MSDFGFHIDVPIRNEWMNVKLLVLSVQNCFNAMFADVDGSETIAMVTGELLENAIKYGSWTREGQRLRLIVSGTRGEARVTVENPAERGLFDDLEKTLRSIAAHADAGAAFRARLLELAASTDPNVSKLGLNRISYEGKCTVEASYENGVVSVSALMRFPSVKP